MILSTDPSATGIRLCGFSSQLCANFVLGGVRSIQFDVGPRSHHLAHRAVGEADNAGNDRSLALFEHARSLRLGDDQVKLLGSDRVARFAVEAEQP